MALIWYSQYFGFLISFFLMESIMCYFGGPNGTLQHCSQIVPEPEPQSECCLSLSFTPTVCHAELNAIMNKNSADVKGCTIYVALFPCNECAKLIIQAGRHRPFSSSHLHPVCSSRLLADVFDLKLLLFRSKLIALSTLQDASRVLFLNGARYSTTNCILCDS